jgi:hypothetical protein
MREFLEQHARATDKENYSLFFSADPADASVRSLACNGPPPAGPCTVVTFGIRNSLGGSAKFSWYVPQGVDAVREALQVLMPARAE